MQYNKQQFNKINDKKIMKKVKKQWVVVSIATLAFLGASAFGMVNTTSAKAAENAPAETQNSDNSDNKSQKVNQDKQDDNDSTKSSDTKVANNSPINNNNDQQDGNTNAKQSEKENQNSSNSSKPSDNNDQRQDSSQNNGQLSSSNSGQHDKDNNHQQDDGLSYRLGENAQNSTITTSDGSVITNPNKNDETAHYSEQIQQGYMDAYKGKGNQSKKLSGQAANYYNSAYDGAIATMNSYNKSTKGIGSGTQDYNYYGNTVTKLGDFKSDSANAQTGSKGFKPKDTTKGDDNVDKNASTSSSSSSMQKNPTDGTPLNYGTSDDTNQGGADNPTDATNSVTKYSTTMDSRINNANNLSVKSNSANQAISIPSSSTSDIANERKLYTDAGAVGLEKAFNQAVNYVLTQQGMADAESGKWQGVYPGSNGKTKDYYLNSTKNDTSNLYDQAYRGARDAMNRYFTNNSYNGNNSVPKVNTGVQAYNQGFNDVVNQAANGTVYVQNGNQWSSIMTASTNTGGVNGNTAGNITTVRLANDVDLSGATNGENNGTITTQFSSITIDGQNHMMDFHGSNYTVNSRNNNLDVYLQNFQGLYGANFYGPFRAQSGAAFHFANINYVGPQLLSSTSNDTYFSGNVNVLVPTSSTNYNSPFQSNVPIEGGGNQENLEVNNFILEPNSHYFGNTSYAVGGTNIAVSGNVTLGENSKMTLIPRGQNGNSNYNSGNYGIVMNNNGAQLNINKNATLNIIAGQGQGILGGGVGSGNAITINVNGGTLNFEGSNGDSGGYNQPINLQNSGIKVSVINGGVLQALMDKVPGRVNGGGTYYGLITNTAGSFNVGSRGNLKVGFTNSKGNFVPYYGSVNINSVGNNHAIFIKPDQIRQFQTTSGSNAGGTGGDIKAYTVAVKYGNQTKYLYSFDLISGSTRYTGIDVDGNRITDGQVTGNTLELSDVPTVSFAGPVTRTTNSNGDTVLTGYARLSNYKQVNGQPIYVGIAYGNNSTDYTKLQNVTGGNYSNEFSKADPNKYASKVDTKNYDGGIIPITYTIPKGMVVNPQYVGMRLHYGINSVNSIVGSDSYSTNIEGYDDAGNGKVKLVSTMPVANGQLGNVNQGTDDALADSVSGTSVNKNAEPFNTKTNSDYQAAYSAVQAGFNAYDNATANQDITQLDAYKQTDNPSAFVKGYNEAAYQAGLQDAQGNRVSEEASKNENYAKAHNDYESAYNTALENPNLGFNDLKNSFNLPTHMLNGVTGKKDAGAALQAVSDAQGVIAFIQDVRNGNQNQKAKIANNQGPLTSYNYASDGYRNAMSVGAQDDNPDGQVNKAEEAGFNYAQSIINGAIYNSLPTTTNNHMNSLVYAKEGNDAAQKGIAKALQNGNNSADSRSSSPSQINTDNYKGNLTAYRDLKYGAYAALNGQSDAKLNTLQKVAYEKVAYTVGMNAFNQDKGSNIPNGYKNTSAESAFKKGYEDATDSAQKGTSDGISAVINNAKASNAPGNIPSNVSSADAYKKGYKGGVDGYKDGSNDGQYLHRDTDDRTKTYQDSYDSAYAQGRQVAGGNDYVKYKQPKASDADYKKGYQQAEQGHTDGYNDAKTQENPKPTKSDAKPYVAGYNNGIDDERKDALNKANQQGFIDGGNDFFNNITRPTTVTQLNGKSPEYTKNYFSAFDATEQGFKDAFAKQANNSSNYSGDSKNAYVNGYNNASKITDQLAKDEQDINNSSDSSDRIVSVTNDVFNATVAGLKGISYQNKENKQGNLYNDIVVQYLNSANQKYDNGITKAQKDANASDSNTITQLSISEYNDGYNSSFKGDENSKAYNSGKADRSNLNLGINADKNGIPTKTGNISDDASDAYKAAYSDSLGITNNSKPSNDNRVWKDAYQEGLIDAKDNVEAIKSQALQAVEKGKPNPFDSSNVIKQLSSSVYSSMNDGYKDGKSGKNTPAQPNNLNYMAGYNAANKSNQDFDKAESENLPVSSLNSSDTYNGAADAINSVNNHGDISHYPADGTHSQTYMDAYNKAVDMANNSIKQAYSDMSTGKNADDSSIDTVADKVLYNNAYKANIKGYNSGISGVGYPNNILGQDGYNLGLQGQQGYKAAVQKAIYNNDTENASSMPGYTPSLNGLNDAKDGKTSTSNDPAYNYAYSQEKAVINALGDLAKGNDANKQAPSGTNVDAYNTAYQATVDGYTDGHARTIASSDNKQDDNRLLYTSSYDQGKQAGRIQRGADDYTKGSVDPVTQVTDSDYGKGVANAKSGFIDGKNNKSAASQEKPYHVGYVQGSSAADGIKQAESNKSSDSGLSADGKNAYYGFKDAYYAVKNPSDTIKPSDGKNVIKNNAYNDAYNNAKAQAVNAENSGVDSLKKHSETPASDGTMQQDAVVDGYTQAKKGYGDQKAGKVDQGNKNPSYLAGVQMAKDLVAGEQAAKTNASTSNEIQSVASKAYNDAVNNVLNGNPTAQPVVSNPNLAQIYNDAYNDALSDAKQSASQGANDYLNGKGKVGGKDLQSQVHDKAYDRSIKGFDDGSQQKPKENTQDIGYNKGYDAGQSVDKAISDQKSGKPYDGNASDKGVYDDAKQGYDDGYNNRDNSKPNNIAYNNGYNEGKTAAKSDASQDAINKQNATDGFNAGLNNATNAKPDNDYYNNGYKQGKSVAQAISDQKSGTSDDSKADDKPSYDSASQGYIDGVNSVINGSGTPAANTPAYITAYNQASTDGKNAYQNGANQALTNMFAQNTAKQTYKNSSLQTLANNGFNDVKSGFDSEFTGSLPANITSTVGQGMKLAQSTKNAIDQEIKGQPIESIPDPIKFEVDKGLNQAQKAVSENPSVNGSQIPSGLSEVAGYAYSKAIQSYKESYNSGVNTAKTLNTTEPTDKNAKQGYDDYMAGLKSVIVSGAAPISNPNVGQQAGIDAKDNYEKAYNDGLKGSTDSNNSDPVYKQANASVKQALQDFANGTSKSDDEINAMPLVQQTAYKDALIDAKNAHEKGANKFIDGEDRPEGNQGIAAAMENGYDDAQKGYDTAENGTKFNDLTSDQKNNPSFMIGFNAATQGNSGLSDLENGKNPGNDKNEQDGYNGANDGFNAGKNGSPKADLSKFSKPYRDAYNKAYNEAKNGVQAGYNDAMKPSSQATDLNKQTSLFGKAYQSGNDKAKSEIAAGVQDYKNNQAQPSGNTAANQYGFNQAKDGYEGKGSDNKDAAYQAGENQSSALEHAKQNVSAGETSNNDPLTNEAEKALINGINDAKNGNSDSKNAVNDNPRMDSDAYAAGVDMGNQARIDGASTFVDGGNKADKSDPVSQAQAMGYDNAQSGFSDGSQNNTKPAKPNDADYMKGYNSSKAVQAAEENAQKANAKETATDTDSFNKATQGYADAVKALKTNRDNPAQAADKNIAYTKAYHDAVARLQPEYNAGAQALTAGKPSIDADLGQADKDAIQAGFDDATKAFNAGMNGDDSYKSANKAESTANQLGKAAEQGIQNVIHDNKPATDDANVDKAINAAKASALKHEFNATSADQDIAANPTLSAVYAKAIGQLHDVYAKAVAAETAGTPVDSNAVAQLGKSDADQAIRAGYHGDSKPANADVAAAYQAGQEAKKGYDLAQSNQHAAEDASDATRQGNTAAFDGKQDILNDNKRDLSTKPLVYQLAYASATQDADDNTQKGSKAFVAGEKRPEGSDSDAKIAQKSYDESQKGYEAAKKGNFNTDGQSDSYKAGVKAYNDAYQGIRYANQNKSIANDGASAEKVASQAVLDGFNHVVSDKYAGNLIYDEIRNDSANEFDKIRQSGAIDANKSQPAINRNSLTSLQQQAYDEGNYDGSKGYNDANNPIVNTNESQNQQFAHHGARDGYQAAILNKTSDMNNQSPVFVAAYNRAYKSAMDAAKRGAELAYDDKANDAQNMNDWKSQAQNSSFNAYQAVIANKLDGSNLSDTQKIGYDKAINLIHAVQDAISNHNQASQNSEYVNAYNTAKQAITDALRDIDNGKSLPADADSIMVPDGLNKDVYKAVYEGTLSGFDRGANSGIDQPDKDNMFFDISFHNGYKLGQNSYNGQVLNDFVANKKQMDFTTLGAKQRYDKAYQDVTDGFNDGLNGKAKKSNGNRYYNNGYQIAIDGLAGMNAASSSIKDNVYHMLSNKDQAFIDGFDGYKLGISDAKHHSKRIKRNLEGKNRMFIYAYEQGMKAELLRLSQEGRKAGHKRAITGRHIIRHLRARHSAAYVRAYVKSYERTFRRRIPRYIYNIRTIYTHNSVKYTRNSRVKKFAYTKRYNSTVFRVIGVKFTKHGTPRYMLKNGLLVTANWHYVRNAYYKHNFKKFRVIKPAGVLIHRSEKFSKRNVVRRIKRGQIFKVRRIIRYHGLTRFYVGRYKYVTSNKTYVKMTRN